MRSGWRAFGVAALSVWNSLADYICVMRPLNSTVLVCTQRTERDRTLYGFIDDFLTAFKCLKRQHLGCFYGNNVDCRLTSLSVIWLEGRNERWNIKAWHRWLSAVQQRQLVPSTIHILPYSGARDTAAAATGNCRLRDEMSQAA